jgi:hypothetical protein
LGDLARGQSFWRAYEKLPPEIRNRVGKQFSLLRTNSEHPSLQFKKVGQSKDQTVWSAWVTVNDRALALKKEDGFLWFWIGDHQTYDDFISR